MGTDEEITILIEAVKLISSIGKEAYKKFLDSVTESDIIWVPLIIPPTWPETERFFELRMPDLIKKGGMFYKHWKSRNRKSESRVILMRACENFQRSEKVLPFLENNPILKEIFSRYPDEKLRIIATLFTISAIRQKNDFFSKILDVTLERLTEKPEILRNDTKLSRFVKNILNEFKEDK